MRLFILLLISQVIFVQFHKQQTHRRDFLYAMLFSEDDSY